MRRATCISATRATAACVASRSTARSARSPATAPTSAAATAGRRSMPASCSPARWPSMRRAICSSPTRTANVVRKVTPAGVISTYAGTGVRRLSPATTDPRKPRNCRSRRASRRMRPATCTSPTPAIAWCVACPRPAPSRPSRTASSIRTMSKWSAGPSTSPTTACCSSSSGPWARAFRLRQCGQPPSPDGTPATTADFGFIDGIAATVSGDIYVADADNARVTKITGVSGLISTYAGAPLSQPDGTPALSGTMTMTNALAVDVAGNVFVSERFSAASRPQAVGRQAVQLRGNWRWYRAPAAAPCSASDILALRTRRASRRLQRGHVFVADRSRDRIYAVKNGTISAFAGGGDGPRRKPRGDAAFASTRAASPRTRPTISTSPTSTECASARSIPPATRRPSPATARRTPRSTVSRRPAPASSFRRTSPSTPTATCTSTNPRRDPQGRHRRHRPAHRRHSCGKLDRRFHRRRRPCTQRAPRHRHRPGRAFQRRVFHFRMRGAAHHADGQGRNGRRVHELRARLGDQGPLPLRLQRERPHPARASCRASRRTTSTATAGPTSCGARPPAPTCCGSTPIPRRGSPSRPRPRR